MVLVPTSIISITIYNQSTGTITKRINIDLERNFNLIERNILQKFDAINDITNSIYLNPDFFRILSASHPMDRIDIINEMATLDKILDSYNDINITKATLTPTIYMLNRPEYYEFNFSNKVFDLGLIEREEWYLNLPTKSRYTVLGLSNTKISYSNTNTIRIAKRLFGLKSPDVPYAALLTINVGIDSFNTILNDFKPSKNSSIFIVDNILSVTVSPDISLLGKSMADEKYINMIFKQENQSYGTFVDKVNNVDMLVSYTAIDPLKWYIISISPLSELFGEIIDFQKIMVIVILVCLILAFFIALFLSDNISNPIRKLVKSMSVVQNGDFDISIQYSRNDEFSSLIRTYKKMVHDIKELINKLYVSEVNKKEAELKVKEAELKAREADLKSLQAQINPHFLYNTLDSINWLAIEHDVSDISTMVTSLSDFFRYSLSKGNNIISLYDEKKQVESYLTIQKIRFIDKLDYHIYFPSQILKYLTVKLIIQPIVENSIIHGIEKMEGKGVINITAEINNGIIEIIVSDNGIGANADELNLTLEKSSTSSRYFAVRNIDERIKRVFGNEYGINFYNNELSGLAVMIRFPALESLEDSNVKDDNS
jgi:two-component system, sensor histidine kinase YesM